jgi:hypothetical protein
VETRKQAITLFSFVCLFSAVLVVIQLALVAAALEALFGRDPSVLIPAAVTSLVLFVINAALLRYALRFDRNRPR